MLQLCDSVKNKDTSTWFPNNKKAENIRSKFDCVHVSFFQNWLENNIEQNLEFELNYDDYTKVDGKGLQSSTELVTNSISISYNVSPYSAPFSPNLRVRIEDLHVKKQDEIKRIANLLCQKDGKIGEVSIIETHPKEYKGVVPKHIVESAEENAQNFDEIKILEPLEKEIADLNKFKNHMATRMGLKNRGLREQISDQQALTPRIDDPILVGKLNGHPDHYFILDYWLLDTPVTSLARNVKQFVEKPQQKIF